MLLEDALKMIRLHGGYMRRAELPMIEYYYIEGDKFLRAKGYEGGPLDDGSEEAVLTGVDILSNDWEINQVGCWKEQ